MSDDDLLQHLTKMEEQYRAAGLDGSEGVKWCRIAADRIRELEAESTSLKDALGYAIIERDETVKFYKEVFSGMRAKMDLAVDALEQLARLGNGDKYGNSHGNMIARTALSQLREDQTDE